MSETELEPGVEAHAAILALRRHEDLNLRGSLCPYWVPAQLSHHVPQHQKTKWQEQTKHTNPQTNQPKEHKFKSKPWKGGAENVCFTLYAPRRNLKLIQHTRKHKSVRLGFIKALSVHIPENLWRISVIMCNCFVFAIRKRFISSNTSNLCYKLKLFSIGLSSGKTGSRWMSSVVWKQFIALKES